MQAFTILHLKIPSVRKQTLLKPHILAFTALLQTSWESDCAFHLWNNRKKRNNNFYFKQCWCIAATQIRTNSKELSTFQQLFNTPKILILYLQWTETWTAGTRGGQEHFEGGRWFPRAPPLDTPLAVWTLNVPYCTPFWSFIVGFNVLKNIYLRYKYQKTSQYSFTALFLGALLGKIWCGLSN